MEPVLPYGDAHVWDHGDFTSREAQAQTAIRTRTFLWARTAAVADVRVAVRYGTRCCNLPRARHGRRAVGVSNGERPPDAVAQDR